MTKIEIFPHFTSISAVFPYVAVVSDNDGSAFITKAEFDSLKNNFQAQIDNYNQSIDSKIDGAIASYLAGIKVNTDETPEYEVYGAQTGFYSGSPVNSFYLINFYNRYWTLDADYWVGLTSGSATQRPGQFGYGYWLVGESFASSPVKNFDPLVIGWVCCLYPSSVTKMYYVVKSDSQQYFGSSALGPKVTAQTIDSSVLRDRLYNCHLSDAFQKCIPVNKPSFDLYKFLDSGTINIKMRKVIRGAEEEGGTHGGRTDNVNHVFSIDRWKVTLNHNGTVTDLKNVYTQIPDRTWIDLNCDVQAGDTLCVSWYGAQDQSVGSYCYSFMSFSQNIPGWKKAN